MSRVKDQVVIVSSSSKTQSGRVGVFDGIRAVAVLLVVAGHTFDNLVSPSVVPIWIAAIVGNASFGVRLFFVLSGYLITTLLLKERDQCGSVSLASFYARRTLRIFPALYFYLLVIGSLVWLGVLNVAVSQFLVAGSYTWNYGGILVADGTAEGSWFLGHLWTLSLEEQFYLFWPVAFVLLPKRWLGRIPWAVAALMPLTRVLTYYLVPEWRGFLGMMFHTAIDSILIGCGFALSRPLIRQTLRRFPVFLLWASLAGVPLVLSPLLRLAYGGSYSVTLGFTIDAVCVGALLVLLHERRAPKLSVRLLELPVMRWLGTLSYSLYLWQQPFLTQLNTTWSGALPWCFPAALGAACFSYYVVEQPILNFKKRFQRASLAG